MQTTQRRRDVRPPRRSVRWPGHAHHRLIQPVLEPLAEAGYDASVFEELGKETKRMLRDLDLEPVACEAYDPCSGNAAPWARNSIVDEWRLNSGNPRGVWEIAENAQQHLKATA